MTYQLSRNTNEPAAKGCRFLSPDLYVRQISDPDCEVVRQHCQIPEYIAAPEMVHDSRTGIQLTLDRRDPVLTFTTILVQTIDLYRGFIKVGHITGILIFWNGKKHIICVNLHQAANEYKLTGIIPIIGLILQRQDQITQNDKYNSLFIYINSKANGRSPEGDWS